MSTASLEFFSINRPAALLRGLGPRRERVRAAALGIVAILTAIAWGLVGLLLLGLGREANGAFPAWLCVAGGVLLAGVNAGAVVLYETTPGRRD